MKTAIVYYSACHGNTKKLLDAIAASDGSVDLIDVTSQAEADLGGYDRIGVASGIYFNSFARQALDFVEAKLPGGKPVFLICTGGAPMKKSFDSITAAVEKKGCTVIGTYSCRGYDTFAPFRLVGGIAKGHPNEKEIAGAVEFYRGLPG